MTYLDFLGISLCIFTAIAAGGWLWNHAMRKLDKDNCRRISLGWDEFEKLTAKWRAS